MNKRLVVFLAFLALLVAPAWSQAPVPVGDEFQVNTYTTGIQVKSAVDLNSEGAFVVVWESLDQDGESYGVFGQWFDSLGSPQGVEFQVNSHTSGSQGTPAVAAHSSGNFVVVWDSDFQDGSYGGVFGQRFGIPIFLGGMESGDFSGWSSVFPPPGP